MCYYAVKAHVDWASRAYLVAPFEQVICPTY
jgi:hypothetical protein